MKPAPRRVCLDLVRESERRDQTTAALQHRPGARCHLAANEIKHEIETLSKILETVAGVIEHAVCAKLAQEFPITRRGRSSLTLPL